MNLNTKNVNSAIPFVTWLHFLTMKYYCQSFNYTMDFTCNTSLVARFLFLTNFVEIFFRSIAKTLCLWYLLFFLKKFLIEAHCEKSLIFTHISSTRWHFKNPYLSGNPQQCNFTTKLSLSRF